MKFAEIGSRDVNKLLNKPEIEQKSKIVVHKRICSCGRVHSKRPDLYEKHETKSQSVDNKNPDAPGILTVIDLTGEFENMATKILPKRESTNDEKEKKYECASCHAKFNHLAEGGRCPDCGIELSV